MNNIARLRLWENMRRVLIQRICIQMHLLEFKLFKEYEKNFFF
jgi:hypothetical protein